MHDPSVSEADLKTYTLENGPAYDYPRRILIKETLPLTGVNKVDLRAVGLELAELKIDGAA